MNLKDGLLPGHYCPFCNGTGRQYIGTFDDEDKYAQCICVGPKDSPDVNCPQCEGSGIYVDPEGWEHKCGECRMITPKTKINGHEFLASVPNSSDTCIICGASANECHVECDKKRH